MSSIFKKIKSAFIIESADGSVEKQQDGSPSQESRDASVDHSSSSNVESIPVGDQIEGVINQKFTDILMKAIEANNREGFDYLEFKRAVKNLQKMEMEEATVYRSAYATAQTMGATPDTLVSSAKGYVSVLKAEEDKFKVALEKQRSKQIESRHSELKEAEASIVQKEQQIEKLRDEIKLQQDGLEKLKANIDQATRKVEITSKNFVASYTDLVQQIQQDIDNIDKYLR